MSRLGPILTFLALATAASAQTIGVSHTGYLLGADDAPIDGPVQITFSIWDDAGSGSAIWTSTACSLTARAGYYATVLGTTCTGAAPLTAALLPAGVPRWLEVQVGTVTLAPRQALVSSATAFDAARLGGFDAADYVRATQLGAAGEVDVDAARITAGTLADGRLSANVPRLDIVSTQTFSGDVAAPAFIGDGSQITGVNALKLGGLTLAELQSAPVKIGFHTDCGSGDGGTLRWTGSALEVCDGAGGWLGVGGGGGSGMSIVGVSPSSGTTLGGTTVTVLGTGFSAGMDVTFDGVPATSVTVISATQLTAVTPPGVEGDAHLAVSKNAASALATNAFRYKDPSVKLHLRFDQAGVVAVDSSLFAHAVTVDGGAVAGGAGGLPQGDAAFSTALSAPNSTGVADGARLANDADWDFGTGDFTLEAWVKPTGYGSGGYGGILSTNDNAQSSLSQGIAVRLDGNSTRILVQNSNSSLYLVSTNSLALNQWSHVAVTRQSDVFRIFINGALDPSTTTYRGHCNSQGQGLTIARPWFNYTTHGWQGYLDEIRVTKGWARYAASFTVPSGPLGLDGVGGLSLRQISPWSGSIAGGTSLSLTGTGFTSGMMVTIGGNPATVVSVPSTTQATVLTPPGSEGTAAVVVSASGDVATRAAGFSYRDPAVRLHLRANNPGGTYFFDDSLSAHSVTREGAAVQNTAGGYPASNSLFSGALYVPNPSGVADGLKLANSSDWDFGTGAFTIEAWVKPTGYGTSGYGGIFTTNEYNSVGVANGIVLRYNANDGRLLAHNQNSSLTYTSALTLPLNQWSHVALVRNGNVFRWFVNGTQDSSSLTYTGACNSQGSGALVGRSWHNYSTHAWQGWVDELRVTKGVARYTASFTAPTAPFN